MDGKPTKQKPVHGEADALISYPLFHPSQSTALHAMAASAALSWDRCQTKIFSYQPALIVVEYKTTTSFVGLNQLLIYCTAILHHLWALRLWQLGETVVYALLQEGDVLSLYVAYFEEHDRKMWPRVVCHPSHHRPLELTISRSSNILALCGISANPKTTSKRTSA